MLEAEGQPSTGHTPAPRERDTVIQDVERQMVDNALDQNFTSLRVPQELCLEALLDPEKRKKVVYLAYSPGAGKTRSAIAAIEMELLRWRAKNCENQRAKEQREPAPVVVWLVPDNGLVTQTIEQMGRQLSGCVIGISKKQPYLETEKWTCFSPKKGDFSPKEGDISEEVHESYAAELVGWQIGEDDTLQKSTFSRHLRFCRYQTTKAAKSAPTIDLENEDETMSYDKMRMSERLEIRLWKPGGRNPLGPYTKDRDLEHERPFILVGKTNIKKYLATSELPIILVGNYCAKSDVQSLVLSVLAESMTNRRKLAMLVLDEAHRVMNNVKALGERSTPWKDNIEKIAENFVGEKSVVLAMSGTPILSTTSNNEAEDASTESTIASHKGKFYAGIKGLHRETAPVTFTTFDAWKEGYVVLPKFVISDIQRDSSIPPVFLEEFKEGYKLEKGKELKVDLRAQLAFGVVIKLLALMFTETYRYRLDQQGQLPKCDCKNFLTRPITTEAGESAEERWCIHTASPCCNALLVVRENASGAGVVKMISKMKEMLAQNDPVVEDVIRRVADAMTKWSKGGLGEMHKEEAARRARTCIGMVRALCPKATSAAASADSQDNSQVTDSKSCLQRIEDNKLQDGWPKEFFIAIGAKWFSEGVDMPLLHCVALCPDSNRAEKKDVPFYQTCCRSNRAGIDKVKKQSYTLLFPVLEGDAAQGDAPTDTPHEEDEHVKELISKLKNNQGDPGGNAINCVQGESKAQLSLAVNFMVDCGLEDPSAFMDLEQMSLVGRAQLKEQVKAWASSKKSTFLALWSTADPFKSPRAKDQAVVVLMERTFNDGFNLLAAGILCYDREKAKKGKTFPWCVKYMEVRSGPQRPEVWAPEELSSMAHRFFQEFPKLTCKFETGCTRNGASFIVDPEPEGTANIELKVPEDSFFTMLKASVEQKRVFQLGMPGQENKAALNFRMCTRLTERGLGAIKVTQDIETMSADYVCQLVSPRQLANGVQLKGHAFWEEDIDMLSRLHSTHPKLDTLKTVVQGLRSPHIVPINRFESVPCMLLALVPFKNCRPNPKDRQPHIITTALVSSEVGGKLIPHLRILQYQRSEDFSLDKLLCASADRTEGGYQWLWDIEPQTSTEDQERKKFALLSHGKKSNFAWTSVLDGSAARQLFFSEESKWKFMLGKPGSFKAELSKALERLDIEQNELKGIQQGLLFAEDLPCLVKAHESKPNRPATAIIGKHRPDAARMDLKNVPTLWLIVPKDVIKPASCPVSMQELHKEAQEKLANDNKQEQMSTGQDQEEDPVEGEEEAEYDLEGDEEEAWEGEEEEAEADDDPDHEHGNNKGRASSSTGIAKAAGASPRVKAQGKRKAAADAAEAAGGVTAVPKRKARSKGKAVPEAPEAADAAVASDGVPVVPKRKSRGKGNRAPEAPEDVDAAEASPSVPAVPKRKGRGKGKAAAKAGGALEPQSASAATAAATPSAGAEAKAKAAAAPKAKAKGAPSASAAEKRKATESQAAASKRPKA